MMQTITQLSRNLRLPRWSRWIPIGILLGVFGFVVLACDSNDPLREARKSLAAGNPAAAIEPLRELIAVDPNNAEYLFLYGRALTATGQFGSAEWPLRKAMEDPEWYERAAIQVANTAMAGGNFDNAAAIFAEILERNPDNLEVRLRRANACAKSPLLTKETLAEVDRIFERSPNELRAYRPQILAYLALGDGDAAGKAIEELGQKIVEQEGETQMSGWHCATSAIFALENGDVDLAKERWAVCEEKYPSHPNVVEQSIIFHNDRGESARSLEIARAAFAIDPSPESGYRIQLASLLELNGMNDEAEALLREGIEAAEAYGTASQAGAWLALTQHYRSTRQLKAAAEAQEHALRISEAAYGPQPDLIFSLAELMIQLDRDDRALELADQMTVAAHRTLVRARVAHKHKRYAEALDLYEETSRLWPDNAFAPYHASRAAMAIGDYDRALDNLYQSIRSDEKATDAREQTARLLAERGNWQAGQQALNLTRGHSDPRAMALGIELVARFDSPANARASAKRYTKGQPQFFGILIEAGANATARRSGAEAAWEFVEPTLSADMQPVNLIPILRAAVTWAPGEAELAQVEPLVRGIVESIPENPSARELEGMYLARTGALVEAEAVFQKVLEDQPGRVSTLLRTAKLKAPSDPEGAAKLVRRTMVELSFDPDLFLATISDFPDSAQLESLLETAIEFAPLDNRILLRQAELLDRQGIKDRRALDLAQRAVRLQGGEEAEAIRDRIQARIAGSDAS